MDQKRASHVANAARKPAKPRSSTTVHFHKSDDRFCGSPQQFRRFTTNPNDVTCRKCAGRDTFTLSPDGAAYLASIGYLPRVVEERGAAEAAPSLQRGSPK